MQPKVEVSELCGREGINRTQYYGWKKQLLSSARQIFDARAGKQSAEEERREAELQRLRKRSGWSARRTLRALGIARRTCYRWLKEEAWARAMPEQPVKPMQPFEALPEEKQAVLGTHSTSWTSHSYQQLR
jgi:hypothetical protein